MIKNVFEKHKIRIVLASICITLFIGLKLWNSFPPLPTNNWNPRQISRIKVTDPEDFKFAVLGDNRGNDSVFEPLLRDIDKSEEIAFAIDVGDLVAGGEHGQFERFFNGGKKGQFQRFLREVQENLTIPFLTAIGNHDLHNNSSRIYQEIFGPTYYAFQVGQSYFIILDATMETGFDEVERQWLENELKKSQTFQARFVFIHVPILNPMGNDSKEFLQQKYGRDLLDLFRHYNVTHLFASHLHGYFSGVWEGVPYTITGGAGAHLRGEDPRHFFYHYIKVHISKGHVETMAVRIDSESTMWCAFDILEDIIENDLVAWSLLLGASAIIFPLVLSLWRQHGLK
jgi:Calcineurin-like phosphoesterase